jgi:diadenosine tetraphosphate (Ap4A) HIT family hydrolase
MSAGQCLACATLRGEIDVPGGVVWEDECWLADHCLGPFGVGALVLKTKAHRPSLQTMTPAEATALGPAMRIVSQAMVSGLPCERVYVSAWVDAKPLHLHFVLEPRYADESGVGAWALQAARREAPQPEVEACASAATRVRNSLERSHQAG